MKTFNMKSVITIVAMIFVATSTNAQTQAQKDSTAWVEYQKEVFSTVVDALIGKANCGEYDAPTVVDGRVTEVVVERHSRLKVSPYVGISFIHGESEDRGTQNVSSTTGGASFEFVNHEKNALLGLYLSVDAEINSSVKIENLKTTAFGLFANAGTVINPCGRLQGTVAVSFGYLNSRSQRYLNNAEKKDPLDYKGNAPYVGGMVKVSYEVFTFNKTKYYKVKGQKVKGTAKNPVELFLKFRIGTTQIGKPKVNNEEFTWKGLRTTFAGGLAFGI